MVAICAVFGCGNCSRKTNISFHRFPQDQARCQEWKKRCENHKLDKIEPSRLAKSHYICGCHFPENEKKRVDNKVFFTNKDIVPTLHIPLAVHINVAEETCDVHQLSRVSSQQIVSAGILGKKMSSCHVPGCNRNTRVWKSNGCRERRPVVFSPLDSDTKRIWSEAIRSFSAAKKINVCDIHFKPDDFTYCWKNNVLEGFPEYLINKRRKRDAVPSLYLDAMNNAVAKRYAEMIGEPNWWTLIKNPEERRPNKLIEEWHSHQKNKIRETSVNTRLRRSKYMTKHIGQVTSNMKQDTSYTESHAPDPCSDDNQTPSQIPDASYKTKTPDFCSQDETNLSESRVSDQCSDDDMDCIHIPDYDTDQQVLPIHCDDKNVDLTQKQEDLETAKNKEYFKLFRKLCSMPLKLPPFWSVHTHPEYKYLLLCRVSGPAIVDKTLKFYDDRRVPELFFEGCNVDLGSWTLENISDVEQLIVHMDSLSPCPGTGLTGLSYSKACSGASRTTIDEVIPCVACNTLRLAHQQKHYLRTMVISSCNDVEDSE